MMRRMSKSPWHRTAASLLGHRAQNTATSWKRRRMRDRTSRTPPMVTIMSVAMKTAISAAVDSLNMCPTLGQSTPRHSCPPLAPCTVSMAPSLASMTSPTDTQPPQRAEPHMNSSKLPSNSPPSQPAFIQLIPSTVAQLTYLPPTVAPSPATLSLLPMRRWMRMTNQIRPARCPARLASLMLPHKFPPSSLTMAGLHNVCRRMSDWTKITGKKEEYRSSE